tara:strand:+ start:224 stop:523 length:300 start_codon:yes stop_codon:yes gene_type:complete
MERIDHIAIAVLNVRQAANWYAKNLDCKIKYKDKTYALLEFDNVDLAIVSLAEHPPHIAIVDESLDENKSGIMKHRDGSVGIYEHDMHGNMIEKIKYKK